MSIRLRICSRQILRESSPAPAARSLRLVDGERGANRVTPGSGSERGRMVGRGNPIVNNLTYFIRDYVSLCACGGFLGMNRYFFHVACARGMYMDENGRDFSDLKEAKAYAATIAAELARDGGWVGGSVCIVN